MKTRVAVAEVYVDLAELSGIAVHALTDVVRGRDGDTDSLIEAWVGITQLRTCRDTHTTHHTSSF